MQRWKRVRAPNFTIEEKDLLVEIINRHKHILDNNRTDHISIQEKQETWLQVATEFNMDATTDRNWRCLKTAYENIKKKMKRENLVFSDLVRESDSEALDEPVQMPLNVVLDVGEQTGERLPSSPAALKSIVKIEKEQPEGEEQLKRTVREKSDGRGVIEHTSTIPLAQWENWHRVHHGGATGHIGVEPGDCVPQSPATIPEPIATCIGHLPPVLSTTRPTDRLCKPCGKPQKRTAIYKRMANENRGRNLVELALIKRRYYLRLLEIAEEQQEIKLRMAEMAEEQHVAKLKMIEAKTNFFLKKLTIGEIKRVSSLS